ncbi:MAG TPA: alcohol dehydrogenase catalytic domain-containing protein [Firmicutes bacterium]|nr:alcohol dehydrogenase catalytic domain-containing protein [Bacillota bacterium]HHY99081.1 alcohol dehydrogenase catalytic domain-containing protein [Bacillota bacterium]
MKAAVFLGPHEMEMREIEIPRPGPGEVRIKVMACAVCGTDVRIYNHGHHNVKPPQIIGHEIAGVIDEVGQNVKGLAVGDHVVVVTSVPCNTCTHCQRGAPNLCLNFTAIGYHYPGGFAQYLIMPEEGVRSGNVIKIPDSLPFNEATLVEPLSCCINGQAYLNIGLGDKVLIIGAGPVGYMHVALAKAQGATKVMLANRSEERLKIAGEFGVDRAIPLGKEDLEKVVMEETDGNGADVVIVACSSGKAQEDAVKVAARQGRISLFGGLPRDNPYINFNSNTVHYKEIAIFGAFGSFNRQYRQALELITSKRIDASRFITATYPLEKITEALEMAEKGKRLKVVVNPW